MCPPMALSAMSSMIKFAGQQDAANAQNKAARANYMQQITQKSLATMQEHTASSDKLFQDTIKAREAQAGYEASVEGMGGSIVGRLIRDKKAVEARNKNNIDTNFEYKLQQTQYELEGLRVQADGRSKSGPSLLATGLEIGLRPGGLVSNGSAKKSLWAMRCSSASQSCGRLRCTRLALAPCNAYTSQSHASTARPALACQILRPLELLCGALTSPVIWSK